MDRIVKEFKVFKKSLNTNSFGLYQLFVMAKDGEVYKTCASQYNAKNEGEIINGIFHMDKNGKRNDCIFVGHELTERLSPDAPEEVVTEIWK